MRICSNCKIKPDYLSRIILADNLRADVYKCQGCHQLMFYRPREDWGGKIDSTRQLMRAEERAAFSKGLSQALKKYKKNYPIR